MQTLRLHTYNLPRSAVKIGTLPVGVIVKLVVSRGTQVEAGRDGIRWVVLSQRLKIVEVKDGMVYVKPFGWHSSEPIPPQHPSNWCLLDYHQAKKA